MALCPPSTAPIHHWSQSPATATIIAPIRGVRLLFVRHSVSLQSIKVYRPRIKVDSREITESRPHKNNTITQERNVVMAERLQHPDKHGPLNGDETQEAEEE